MFLASCKISNDFRCLGSYTGKGEGEGGRGNQKGIQTEIGERDRERLINGRGSGKRERNTIGGFLIKKL